MDKTEKLKHIILSKYNSVREFSKVVEIPSTTLASALDKGIGGMAVDRIIKICDVLNIDIKTFDPLEIISQNNNLSQEETTLLENYNKLNSKGKERLIDYSDELTTNIKYMDNSNNEITATINNVTTVDFNSNNKDDDEEVFVPYKSLDEIDGCNAAHADNLTPEQLEHVKSIILELENKRKLEEFNKRKNK
ncbi:hypothetical protein [Clostridium neonatale]|uniref:hypothetical protein n=1 Tax=Clostridium neonatale TaxID=137838 RepID=UPI00291C1C6C|nr:putative transcriptional regulator [Clostridium neonatale]